MVCAEAVKGAICSQRDTQTEKALEWLDSLHRNSSYLQQLSQEKMVNLEAKIEGLKKSNAELETRKCGLECSISKLNVEKAQAERTCRHKRQELSREEDELGDARRRLRDSQQELKKAEMQKEAIKSGCGKAAPVVVGGAIALGLVTFGVGGILTSAAAAAASASALTAIVSVIAAAESKVKAIREEIQNQESDIDRIKTELTKINNILTDKESKKQNYREQIATNKQDAQDLHQKITTLKQSVAFEMEALLFCQLFQLSVTRAGERTERLQKIVCKAQEERRIKILRADGTITIAKTFVDAWEEVTVKQGQAIEI